MKIKTLKGISKIWVALFIVALSFACSDGNLVKPGSDLEPPLLDVAVKPTIVTFEANPREVVKGGSTTISWKVENASTVEITATSPGENGTNFHVSGDKLEGSAVAENIQADTVFTIKAVLASTGEEATASKDDAKKLIAQAIKAAAEEAVASAESKYTITVKVIDVESTIATMTADKSSVGANEMTIIRWEVTPADSLDISVEGSDGLAILATSNCAGDAISISQSGTTDGIVPAKGCAAVAPAAETTYTVKAKMAGSDDVIAEASTTIAVAAAELSAQIFAGDAGTETDLKVDSFAAPVKISWRVAPAGAAITITPDPSADCVLPVEDKTQMEGSVMCTIAGETTFKIKAELAGATVESSAHVGLNGGGSGGSAGLVVASQWAFEGEEATLNISLAANSDANAIEKVFVGPLELDPSVIAKLKLGSISVPKIPVSNRGVPVKLVYGGGKEIDYQQSITVVPLTPRALAPNEKMISSIAIDSELKHRYVAMERSDFGAISVYHDGAPVSINIKNVLQYNGNVTEEFLSKIIKDYPVTLGVRDGNPEEVYAGTSGALMRSTDGGASWSKVLVSLYFGTGNESSGDHKTCGRGNIQKGVEPRKGVLTSANRICDVIATKEGRLIVATDYEVLVEENMDDGKIEWKDNKTTPFYKHVVNDIEMVGGKVFAAADNGVFVSDDNGLNWSEFGAMPGGEAYSISSDGNATIIVAAENGVYSSSTTAASWKELGIGGPATKAVIDPFSAAGSPTIIAATPAGIKITRDGGANWASIKPSGLGEAETAITALSLVAKRVDANNTISYGIGIGTTTGGLMSPTVNIPSALVQ